MKAEVPGSGGTFHAAVTPGALLISKYRVERVLAEGGMGLVVVARHVDLDERVALKFIRPEIGQKADASHRFLREARVAVKIKSEHVVRLLDVGRLEDDTPFLVMECLEGTDLRTLVREHGALSIEDAVDYVIQACEGLGEAHGQGIVHRDVKPSNLFVVRRADGQPLVKILDFGISKVMEPGEGTLTGTNVMMGSVGYMSPEQMESARDVDPRTDVYSLGVTLFELLAGCSPFRADTTPLLCAQIVGGIVTPLRDLRPEVTVDLERVVRRAMALDRTARHDGVAALAGDLASFAPPRSAPTLAAIRRLAAARAAGAAGDLASADTARAVAAAEGAEDRGGGTTRIGGARGAHPARPRRSTEDPLAAGRGVTGDEPRRTTGRSRRVWMAAAVLFALAVLAVWFLRPTPRIDRPVMELDLAAPAGASLGAVASAQLGISPDGGKIVFHAVGSDGKRSLWLRHLATGDATRLPGTEDATGQPFWSPDGRSLGFIAKGKLQRIGVDGHQTAEMICNADPIADNIAGAWNADGVILFTQPGKPLQKISGPGQTPVDLFPLDASAGETGQRGPVFLPGGNRFLYHSSGRESGEWLGSLDGKTRRFLFAASSSAATYSPSPSGKGEAGFLLYLVGHQLLARPFDARRGELIGTAALVASPLPLGPSWAASDNGVLVFRRWSDTQTRLGWFDRSGKPLGESTLPAPPGAPGTPRLSPDGKTIAFARSADRKSDIWLIDVARNTSSQFSLDAVNSAAPFFSPDGSQILFTRPKQRQIVEQPANGGGSPTVVVSRKTGSQPFVTGLSSDGKWMVVSESDESGPERVTLVARHALDKSVVLAEGHHEGDGAISPNGRWILFSAAPAGGREVFVQPMPGEPGASAAGKVQISSDGGNQPVWRADGKEIFYLANDGTLMSVIVESAAGHFRPAAPKPLFQTRVFTDQASPRQYDVSADGQRFLLNQPPVEAREAPITLIVGWPQLIEFK